MSNLTTGNDPKVAERNNYNGMLWAVVAAFGTYFCMYAFRKPFSVAEYEGVQAWGWQYKTIAVSAQVMGYMLSKFIGLNVLPQLPPERRAISIVGLIAIAELALILFGLIPAPFNLICLFLNGLPLGMVFGLVLGFLEGRQQTEALAAGLCTSFILADGFTKSVGKWLMELGVPQFWMPAATGVVFFLPLLAFVWMLTRITPPSQIDIKARSERLPVYAPDRRAFFRKYAWGLVPILFMFLLVTVLRSVRSDFAPEIWTSLGVTTTPEIFSYSELWVGLGVTLANGAAVMIRNNVLAFRVALGICVLGFIVLLGATWGEQQAVVSPFVFMVLLGLGLYLPYVATHTTIFERLIAMTRDRSNLVHLMYLADSLGYLGYVTVMLCKNSVETGGDFMVFFRPMCYVVAVLSLLCMVASFAYFQRVRQSSETPSVSIVAAGAEQ